MLAKFEKFLVQDSSSCAPLMLPREAWRRIASFDSTPFDSVGFEVPDSDLRDWFQHTFHFQELDPRSQISIGGYEKARWFSVKSGIGSAQLADLWLSTDSRELLILDFESRRVLGIISEEYDFEAHKFDIE